MIYLFTDFGSADIYVGQVKMVLAERAPGIPVIDLLHDAPAFKVAAGAHLLAALAARMRAGDVVMAVVDPEVGGVRDAVAVYAAARWFVAPDNGLASVAAARSNHPEFYTIVWRPDALSASFHGRDLFAPVAAMLARGDQAGPWFEPRSALSEDLGAEDLAEIIYLDHYGNALTGLRAGTVAHNVRLVVAGHSLPYARVFSDVGPGEPFWYENSIGLIEIAANASSAVHCLGLTVGARIARDT